VLDLKRNVDLLVGKMAILWTGSEHDTPGFADDQRDYAKIERSGHLAREGVLADSLPMLADGIRCYHEVQLEEGMPALPEIDGALAKKYCGGGHGGYAVYLFESGAARDAALASMGAMRPVEPYQAS
jgi:hypothetical protein